MAMNIKVILSSVRHGRFGDKPAKWITALAKEAEGVSVELLDLKDYQLPIFSEATSPAYITGDNHSRGLFFLRIVVKLRKQYKNN